VVETIQCKEKRMSPVDEQAANVAKNMFPINAQFVRAAKTNFEAQISVVTALTTKAIESVEQVVDLNFATARASVEDSAASARQMIAAKDPQELLAVTAAQAQPAVARAIAYTRQLAGITAAAQAEITGTFRRELAGIAAAAQAEVTRTAVEKIAETGRKISVLVDEISKTVPTGSENVVAVMKSAVDNATAGYEQFAENAKRAAEAMEANLHAAVNQVSPAAEHKASTTRARRR
jgi:phasin family protein